MPVRTFYLERIFILFAVNPSDKNRKGFVVDAFGVDSRALPHTTFSIQLLIYEHDLIVTHQQIRVKRWESRDDGTLLKINQEDVTKLKHFMLCVDPTFPLSAYRRSVTRWRSSFLISKNCLSR